MNKKQKGFTLVELMIVVAIIGILAAIAIPKFASMLEKSREGATKGNISAVKSAISIYYGDHEGEWPDDITETGATSWSFLTSYMDALPAVKVTGNNENNDTTVVGFINPSTFEAGPLLYYVVTATTPPAADGRQWQYSTTSGDLWVNSNRLDTKGRGYDTFGYE